MGLTEFNLTATDGTKIVVHKWQNTNNNNINGIILILHGMTEHSLRYTDLANFLTANNYIVYACDHRGHGKTGLNSKSLGTFGENGWQGVVDDIHLLVQKIKSEYNNTPLVLLGHSMGSLLARTCIQQFGNEFNGTILSGTTIGSNVLTRRLGLLITNLYIKLKGKDKDAVLLDNLTFGNYNKHFKPSKTKFDWLSSDSSMVDKYINDELCGFTCKSLFFRHLLTGTIVTINKTNIRKIPINLPILIISGSKDPVGGNSKEVIKLFNTYKKLGLKNVKLKLYEDGRHEILNEVNRTDVYSYILTWINHINNKTS